MGYSQPMPPLPNHIENVCNMMDHQQQILMAPKEAQRDIPHFVKALVR